jgi:hypothetical protein
MASLEAKSLEDQSSRLVASMAAAMTAVVFAL